MRMWADDQYLDTPQRFYRNPSSSEHEVAVEVLPVSEGMPTDKEHAAELSKLIFEALLSDKQSRVYIVPEPEEEK